LVYRVAWLTFEVGRRVVDVDCLGIINILNNYQQNPPADSRLPARPAPHVIREFIQHLATPEALARETLRLLNDSTARANLVSRVDGIVSTLEAEGAALRASQAILAAL
jgi:lipid A disaccharide synthetase